MRYGCLPLAQALANLAARHILGLGDLLQVVWIDAASVATKVVNNEFRIKRPAQ
jgi:hypothetical protein